jgi:hypothetical protein
MVRTQIQLTDEQHRRLRRLARRLGESLAEAVRRCVDDRLEREDVQPSREERPQAVLAVFGRYEDPEGLSNVAVEHDRYLVRAYSH